MTITPLTQDQREALTEMHRLRKRPNQASMPVQNALKYFFRKAEIYKDTRNYAALNAVKHQIR